MAAAPFLRLLSGDFKVAGRSVLSICVRWRSLAGTVKIDALNMHEYARATFDRFKLPETSPHAQFVAGSNRRSHNSRAFTNFQLHPSNVNAINDQCTGFKEPL